MRCLSCNGDYCRECVAEHDARVLCAACLAKATVSTPSASRGRLRPLRRAGSLLLGVGLLVLFFYGVGQILVSIPGELHENAFGRTAGENPRP